MPSVQVSKSAAAMAAQKPLLSHPCFDCGLMFAHEEDLNQHNSVFHNPDDMITFLVCDLCGKLFDNCQSLGEHQFEHDLAVLAKALYEHEVANALNPGKSKKLPLESKKLPSESKKVQVEKMTPTVSTKSAKYSANSKMTLKKKLKAKVSKSASKKSPNSVYDPYAFSDDSASLVGSKGDKSDTDEDFFDVDLSRSPSPSPPPAKKSKKQPKYLKSADLVVPNVGKTKQYVPKKPKITAEKPVLIANSAPQIIREEIPAVKTPAADLSKNLTKRNAPLVVATATVEQRVQQPQHTDVVDEILSTQNIIHKKRHISPAPSDLRRERLFKELEQSGNSTIAAEKLPNAVEPNLVISSVSSLRADVNKGGQSAQRKCSNANGESPRNLFTTLGLSPNVFPPFQTSIFTKDMPRLPQSMTPLPNTITMPKTITTTPKTITTVPVTPTATCTSIAQSPVVLSSTCPNCHQNHGKPWSLIEHMTSVHGAHLVRLERKFIPGNDDDPQLIESYGQKNCQYCIKQFDDVPSCLNHIVSEHRDKLFECATDGECEVCFEVLSSVGTEVAKRKFTIRVKVKRRGSVLPIRKA